MSVNVKNGISTLKIQLQTATYISIHFIKYWFYNNTSANITYKLKIRRNFDVEKK